ncbi:MAG: hypothetical protein H0V51_12735 [Chloroflexi bacterium]|nr:hypothetical protein [Chloroflexota bacterium]
MDQAFIDALREGIGDQGGFLVRPPATYRWPEEVLEMVTQGQVEPALIVPASGALRDIVLAVEEDYRLPPEDTRRNSEIDQRGIEAIAWYISFHTSPAAWGIYIADDGVEAFAQHAFGSLPGLSDGEKLRLALQVVIDHERFHYWTDVACAQIEFASWRPIYLPYLLNHPDLSSSVCQLEEALANSRAWRTVKAREARMALETHLRYQPPGYRDWNRYRSPNAYALGRRQLGADIHSAPASPAAPAPPRVLPPAGALSKEERRAVTKQLLASANAKRLNPAVAPVRWRAAPYEWFFDEHRAGAGKAQIPIRSIPSRHRERVRPFLVPHARPIVVQESPRFVAQLRKLAKEIQQKWEHKTKPSLETGDWNGLKFDKKAGSKDVWRCRVGLRHRAEFQHLGGIKYEALRIGSRESL